MEFNYKFNFSQGEVSSDYIFLTLHAPVYGYNSGVWKLVSNG